MKKLIVGLTALFFSLPVLAGQWAVSLPEAENTRLYTTPVENGRVAGMFCSLTENSCLYFLSDSNCTLSNRLPILANATSQAGVIPGMCVQMDAYPASSVRVLTIAGAFDKQMKERSDVSIAVPDEKTEEIETYRIPLSTVPYEEVQRVFQIGA